MVEIEKKERMFTFDRKTIARDYLNKLEPAFRANQTALAKEAGERAGIPWKKVQLMELNLFLQLTEEFGEYNELGEDPFLGKK